MPVNVPPAPSCPGVAQTSGCTTVITEALLFVETGSVVVELAVAVFVIVLDVTGVVTLIVIIALVPCAKVIADANEHVTVVVPEHVQLAGPLAVTSVVPVGIVSASETFAALDWPKFCTKIV